MITVSYVLQQANLFWLVKVTAEKHQEWSHKQGLPPYFPYTPINYLRETAGLLFPAISLNRRLPGKQAQ
jgi:hypothetical protein